MRTGVTCMGHHNPRHVAADFVTMRVQGLDAVLLVAQENDFHYFTSEVSITPELARGQPPASSYAAPN